MRYGRYWHTVKSSRDYAIFRLAYHHGLRASEVGMIQMTDYYPAPRMGSMIALMIQRLERFSRCRGQKNYTGGRRKQSAVGVKEPGIAARCAIPVPVAATADLPA